MESELLNVHDRDLSTEGGPPGWLAFAGVALEFLIITALVLLAFCIGWI